MPVKILSINNFVVVLKLYICKSEYLMIGNMKGGYQMIVASDGSGDFTSIQEAVGRVPEGNKEIVKIYIKNGVYKEKLHIEKNFITLIGQNAKKTILTYDDYAKKKYVNGEKYNTFNSASVFIGGDNFFAQDITFENSAGTGDVVGQAVAAYVDGDRVAFKNCRFLGNQDTLFTGPLPPHPLERGSFGGPRDSDPRRCGRQYYEGCYIEGDIDFIFGSATAVFNKCEIFSKKRSGEQSSNLNSTRDVNGWITAASTPKDVEIGYVFIDCKLNSDAPAKTVYLGRPWRNYAKTAFINCFMGEHIIADGWDNWNKTESEKTTVYCEYNSQGVGASNADRVKWSKILSSKEAQRYDILNVLAGIDGWDPEGLAKAMTSNCDIK